MKAGRDLNLEQVRRRLAWHYKQYQGEQDASDRARYANVEIEARAAQRRLWALPKAPKGAHLGRRHGGKQSAQAAPTERTASACGPKRYCREMVSCDEARHYLSACGLTRLDRDGDGVPCEALCR